MKKNKGFDYDVSLEIIRAYQKVSVGKRLLWLYQGNLLRQAYPKRIIKLQDKFREGQI